MKVEQLHKLLTLAIEFGGANWPVQLMIVEEGVTFAQDLNGEIAKKYDGDRVWLWEKEVPPHPPEWAME